jgi:hypothetical protein
MSRSVLYQCTQALVASSMSLSRANGSVRNGDRHPIAVGGPSEDYWPPEPHRRRKRCWICCTANWALIDA